MFVKTEVKGCVHREGKRKAEGCIPIPEETATDTCPEVRSILVDTSSVYYYAMVRNQMMDVKI
jgi:hypothetical protein